METETRMKKMGVRNTIVFQGSARINEESDNFKKNGYDRYYTEAYELSKQLTIWSEETFSEREKKFYISSGAIVNNGSIQQRSTRCRWKICWSWY